MRPRWILPAGSTVHPRWMISRRSVALLSLQFWSSSSFGVSIFASSFFYQRRQKMTFATIQQLQRSFRICCLCARDLFRCSKLCRYACVYIISKERVSSDNTPRELFRVSISKKKKAQKTPKICKNGEKRRKEEKRIVITFARARIDKRHTHRRGYEK